MAKGSLRDREFKTQQTERNAALKENTQRAREEAVEEILRVEEEARMRIEENEKALKLSTAGFFLRKMLGTRFGSVGTR